MRVLFVILGALFLALGTIGLFLPILPTVPLYLLSAACLARGSRRLDAWLRSTSLYRRSVAPIREGRGMTLRAKLTSFAMVTALLALGFAMMSRVVWGRAVLVAVWAFHIWLFFFRLPTRAKGDEE